jgi:hypothetical protein
VCQIEILSHMKYVKLEVKGTKLQPVIPTTEVIPSRGVRALEGEGRGLSHLEVIARGRLWRQLAGRGIDQGAQRVTTDLFVSILLFL